jgi:hypothetical protein
VLSLANKVSNHAMIFADLKIARSESHQFRPSQGRIQSGVPESPDHVASEAV